MSDDTPAVDAPQQPRRNPPRRATRSASSSASSVSLAELPNVPISNPRIAAARMNSGVTDHLVPAMRDVQIEDDEIEILTWEKDGIPIAKEFGDFYRLAKDIPHDLQDHINNMNDFARRGGDMQLILFESMMSENTAQDEPGAPDVKIINDVDDELTPPFEFHYSNLMWHSDKVPKPDLTNLRGCGCHGACDPLSKTCLCVKRQQAYHSLLGLSGFAYDARGRLKPGVHSFPIFECNAFCGCDDECRNRVSWNLCYVLSNVVTERVAGGPTRSQSSYQHTEDGGERMG